jgi:putative transposase
MVVFSIHFHQRCFHVFAYLGEHPTQPVYGVTIKHLAAIFRHKDQMNMHLENAMPAVSNRFVFNKALAMQKVLYERGEKKLSYAGLCKELAAWKVQPETLWLSETHSQVLQQSLKDLERAYKNFFDKRADFPRFKKKGMGDSFRYPQGCRLGQANSRVFLPKLGWIRYRNCRDILGTVKNITVSANGGKWYVSIQTEREIEQPVHPATNIVGIDVGITRFATLSDGSHIEPLNYG